MHRRVILTLCGSSLSTAVAGCVDSSPSGASARDTPSKSPSTRSCPGSGGVSFTTETDEFAVTTDDNSVEAFDLTLVNRTECPLKIGPEDWVIEREAPDGWEEIASGDGDGEKRTLHSGDDHDWLLSVAPHPTHRSETETFVFVDLAEGVYRCTITGRFTGGEQITQAAQFEVVQRTTEPESGT